MTMVQVTAMTAQGEWRDFFFQQTDLEVAYTVLHTIARRGDTLISATLQDKQGCLPLPLDAFEEPTFLNPIQALSQQWEELLAQPVVGSSSSSEFSQQHLQIRQHVLELEAHLVHVETILETSQQLYEQLLLGQHDYEKRSAIKQRYSVNINRQRRSTQTIRAFYQQALHRIKLLDSL